jgi:hypothetical protein
LSRLRAYIETGEDRRAVRFDLIVEFPQLGGEGSAGTADKHCAQSDKDQDGTRIVLP